MHSISFWLILAPSKPVHRRDRQLHFCHRVAAVFLLAHLLAVIALAVSPRLHHWVHPDADDDGHDCAVVLFLHGGGNVPSEPALALMLVAPMAVATLVPRLPVFFVASTFAANCVFEHAPPAVG